MPFSAKALVSNRDFFPATLRCADGLMAIHDQSPRIASIFAAQQRWLMAHVGFALHHGYPDTGDTRLYSARFVDLVLKHRIASRNTAVAFIQEMLAYRFLRVVPDRPDRRMRVLEPTEIANEHLALWLQTHLFVLDSLDGKNRVATLGTVASAVAAMQPQIAHRIFNSASVRSPGQAFDLFNGTSSGGIVMDYLISRVGAADTSGEKTVIGPISLKEIRERFLISNSNLKRLLKQAAALESLGWTGAPGRSDFWLSKTFIGEYLNYQAEKFEIIDMAFEAVFGAPRPAA